ncbi:MAG: ATP-binding protein [Candidatus Kapaibacterium sp.]
MLTERKFSIANNTKSLENLHYLVETSCEDFNISNDSRFKIHLIVEEILSNTIKYGYNPYRSDEIEVEIHDYNTTVKIIIKDSADLYNPYINSKPDTESDINDRKLGGLGVHFIKNICKTYNYSSSNKGNIIEVEINKQ